MAFLWHCQGRCERGALEAHEHNRAQLRAREARERRAWHTAVMPYPRFATGNICEPLVGLVVSKPYRLYLSHDTALPRARNRSLDTDIVTSYQTLLSRTHSDANLPQAVLSSLPLAAFLAVEMRVMVRIPGATMCCPPPSWAGTFFF